MKNLGKNKIYLIIIGLTAIVFTTTLIYSYVEFSGTRINIVPIEEGKPYCGAIGSRSEGWYINSNFNRPKLIRWDNCEGCSAVCKAIGTRSEGWYSSCDGKLIKWDNCKETQEEKCGIENCHGLDITCGPNIPDACTEIYMIGDGCRQYAKCEIINGKCQLVQNKKFEDCKSCVEKCSEDFKNDPIKLSQCAYKCAEAGGEQTCDEKCKSLNYKSGICRTWPVVPDAEWGCKGNEKDIGETSDCTTFRTIDGIDERKIGVGETCCCQEENSECAKEGEKVNRNPLMGSTNKQCCPGLIENRASRSYSICEKVTEDCAKEGESVPVVPGALKCCEGLTKISCARPDANGNCPEGCVGASICANCGNGICGLGENKCNCPEDCKEQTKPITVLSPNGGEEWEIGGTYDITWESSDTVENVVIDLYNCNSLPCKSIAISPGISAVQGKYSWMITVYDPGDKYKIQITSIELGQFGSVTRKNISDQSDNYFSITPSNNLVELEGKIVVSTEGNRSESWGIEVDKGPTEYMGKTVGFCGDLTVLGLDIELFKNKRISVSIEPRIDCFSIYQKTGRVLKWEKCGDEVSCRDENYPCSIDNIPCCSGLKEVPYAFAGPDGSCVAATCGSICKPCGNGVCDANENKCNCPEDCKENKTLSANLNNDGRVGAADLGILLSCWEKNPSETISCQNSDIDKDGNIGAADLGIMLSQWTK